MDEEERRERFERLLGSKRFDVESAISIYARNFVTLPAFSIYEPEIIAHFKAQIEPCHIYMIGLLPGIEFVGCTQSGDTLITSYRIAGQRHELDWSMPREHVLKGDGDQTSGWYVQGPDGTRSFPDQQLTMQRLNALNAVSFEVLYIGQAYGDGGSRNALDRLLKHETLQKIAVKGVPAESVLTLLLIEIAPGNRMITSFNPFAKDTTQGEARIDQGLTKLFNTTDAERTTLFEASFIRYFEPRFNTEFKNSFPSTNLKTLADCYAKDIAAITAEINIDDLPFRLFSAKVPARDWHTAHHDLHKDGDRRVFFHIDGRPAFD